MTARPTVAQWVSGARPRTLAAAVSPVAVGTAAAAAAVPGAGFAGIRWGIAALALAVAVALQVGVNYANDYSDGIRGTDTDRVGPFRLVGSGAARPADVRNAALLAFGVACAAGLAIVVLTSHYELLLVGAVCVAAAWFYTGGRRPYGYAGLGEVAVFVFFGLVAVIGTTYVQIDRVTPLAVLGGAACGGFACAILVANNLRDLPTDAVAGKRTLAVRLGAARTRTLFTSLIVLPYVLLPVLAVAATPAVLIALASAPPGMRAVAAVRRGAEGRALIPVLGLTGAAQLLYAGLLSAALLAA